MAYRRVRVIGGRAYYEKTGVAVGWRPGETVEEGLPISPIGVGEEQWLPITPKKEIELREEIKKEEERKVVWIGGRAYYGELKEGKIYTPTGELVTVAPTKVEPPLIKPEAEWIRRASEWVAGVPTRITGKIEEAYEEPRLKAERERIRKEQIRGVFIRKFEEKRPYEVMKGITLPRKELPISKEIARLMKPFKAGVREELYLHPYRIGFTIAAFAAVPPVMAGAEYIGVRYIAPVAAKAPIVAPAFATIMKGAPYAFKGMEYAWWTTAAYRVGAEPTWEAMMKRAGKMAMGEFIPIYTGIALGAPMAERIAMRTVFERQLLGVPTKYRKMVRKELVEFPKEVKRKGLILKEPEKIGWKEIEYLPKKYKPIAKRVLAKYKEEIIISGSATQAQLKKVVRRQMHDIDVYAQKMYAPSPLEKAKEFLPPKIRKFMKIKIAKPPTLHRQIQMELLREFEKVTKLPKGWKLKGHPIPTVGLERLELHRPIMGQRIPKKGIVIPRAEHIKIHKLAAKKEILFPMGRGIMIYQKKGIPPLLPKRPSKKLLKKLGFEKAIEIHPEEKWLQTVATVAPFYYPKRQLYVKTPEGFRMMKIKYQLQRKVAAAYLESGMPELSKHYEDVMRIRGIARGLKPVVPTRKFLVPEKMPRMVVGMITLPKGAPPITKVTPRVKKPLVYKPFVTERYPRYPRYKPTFPRYPTYPKPTKPYPKYPVGKPYPKYPPAKPYPKYPPAKPYPKYPPAKPYPKYPVGKPYPKYPVYPYPKPTKYPTYPKYPKIVKEPFKPELERPRKLPRMFKIPKWRKVRYQPSLVAMEYQIYGKPVKGVRLALGVRPAPKWMM